MRKTLLSLASIGLLFGSSAVFAGNPANASRTAATTSTESLSADAQFARKADQANLAEVKLGMLAEQKGTNQTVKNFGKRMVMDHSKAEDNLKNAAAADNLALPATLSAKDQAVYDHLSKLSGQSFDQAYARDMLKDHETDVSEFRHEANDGKNPAIRRFASETLPVLETHLKLAHEMMNKGV